MVFRPQATEHSLGKTGLAGAQLTIQEDDVPGLGMSPNRLSHCLSPIRAARMQSEYQVRRRM